jgi:ATP-dependent 26S proteasome regulatory subunit
MAWGVLTDEQRENRPPIVFIDEIDAAMSVSRRTLRSSATTVSLTTTGLSGSA